MGYLNSFVVVVLSLLKGAVVTVQGVNTFRFRPTQPDIYLNVKIQIEYSQLF